MIYFDFEVDYFNFSRIMESWDEKLWELYFLISFDCNFNIEKIRVSTLILNIQIKNPNQNSTVLLQSLSTIFTKLWKWMENIG